MLCTTNEHYNEFSNYNRTFFAMTSVALYKFNETENANITTCFKEILL